MSKNIVILEGRVGQTPEIIEFKDGNKIAKVSLATSETWKDKQGEKHEETEWHTVIVRGFSAEFVEKYVDKGYGLLVVGSIRTRNYEKDGEKRYVTEIHTSDVQVTRQPREPQEQQGQQRNQRAKGRPASKPVDAYDETSGSGDLPF